MFVCILNVKNFFLRKKTIQVFYFNLLTLLQSSKLWISYYFLQTKFIAESYAVWCVEKENSNYTQLQVKLKTIIEVSKLSVLKANGNQRIEMADIVLIFTYQIYCCFLSPLMQRNRRKSITIKFMEDWWQKSKGQILPFF